MSLNFKVLYVGYTENTLDANTMFNMKDMPPTTRSNIVLRIFVFKISIRPIFRVPLQQTLMGRVVQLGGLSL